MSDQQLPQQTQAQYLPLPKQHTAAWVKFALLLVIGTLSAGVFFYIRDVTRLQDATQDLSEVLDEKAKIIANLKLDLEGKLQGQNALLAADLKNQTLLIQTISDNLGQQVDLAVKKHSLAGGYRNYEERWITQQTSYLLRMANISLHINTSTTEALRYLRLASKVLNRKTIPELIAIRSAVIRQISALQTSTLTDTQTPYLRLNDLLEQLPLLPLSPNWVFDEAEDGNVDFDAQFDNPIIGRIMSLFRFRVEDELSVRSPQIVQMARQQLGLVIEQAKAALLGRQAETYKLATAYAEQLVDVYFDAAHPQVQDFRSNLAEVAALGEKLALPDTSEPLTLLDNWRSQQEDDLSLETAISK